MTSKKSFQLHQVLNYRADVERMKKEEFAVARQELDTAVDHLVREQNELEALSINFKERQGNISSIAELRMYSDFFARKKEELKDRQEMVEMLDRVLEERRGELVVATKEKKVLETLKEKKDTEFRRQQNLKEREFMDEISVQKKGRG